jgi:hypothetical protein
VRPETDIASDVSLCALQNGEVEFADRLFDQAAVVLVVESLARHLRRRQQAELDDFDTDLLERTTRLGLDLLARLLQAPLAVGLELFAHPPLVRVGHAASLAEDPLGFGLRAADQLAVLLQQPPGLLTRVVGFLQRYRLSTNSVIRKQTIVQIISPGVTWISGLVASGINQTRT